MEKVLSAYYDIEKNILKTLAKFPLIGFYARTRGWDYVLSWAHRGAGILLVLYLWFHIYTLAALKTPDLFAEKMKFFQAAAFVFLEWLLAIPVIFHALNGGRLILYESFYSESDPTVTRGILIFSIFYVALVGLVMIMGSEQVSPILLWLCCVGISLAASYIVAIKLVHCENSAAWKLQRITGAFLLLMIPAHLLFMHLQPDIGHDPGVIIARMQHSFIKIVNLLLLICVIYHAGYGIIEVAKDYIFKKFLNNIFAAVIIIIMAIFLFIGARLTLFL